MFQGQLLFSQLERQANTENYGLPGTEDMAGASN